MLTINKNKRSNAPISASCRAMACVHCPAVLPPFHLPSSIQFMGSQYTVSVMTPLQYHLVRHMLPPPAIDLTKELHSPMPGVVVSLLVAPGDLVKAGAPVLGVAHPLRRRAALAPCDIPRQSKTPRLLLFDSLPKISAADDQAFQLELFDP